MSQHEFEFETGNAAKTLSEILALIAPDEAAELGERIQSGFKSVHHVLGASLSELSDLGGPKTVRLVRLVERLVRDLALERIHETQGSLIRLDSSYGIFARTAMRSSDREVSLPVFG